MIVKLLKPTPLVDHVAYAGEFIDGDVLLKRMIASGHAVLVEDNGKKSDAATTPDDNSKAAATTPDDNSKAGKSTEKTSAKKKTTADKE